MANTYPKSQVMLYATEIRPGSRIVVEELETYLDSITDKSTIDDFQFIKHNKELTIKIDYTQKDSANFPYNYAKITNLTTPTGGSELPMYYFIMDATPVSSHALSLTLVLDVLNVSYNLADTVSIPNPYRPKNFNADTVIDRQHEDRFFNQTTSGGTYVPGTSNQTIFRRIDFDSEGFSPIQNLVSDTKLNATDGTNWYLVYRSAAVAQEAIANSAIDTFICAEKPIPIATVTGTGTSKTITYQDLTADTTYYCLPANNEKWQWTIRSRTTWGGGGAVPTYTNKSINVYNDGTESKFGFCWSSNNGDVHHETYYNPVGFKFHVGSGQAITMTVFGSYLEDITHTDASTGNLTYDVWCIGAPEYDKGGAITDYTPPSLTPGMIQSFEFTLPSSFIMNNFYFSKTCLTSADTYTITNAIDLTNIQYWDASNRAIGSDTKLETYGIDSIDRTDTKMIKIIKLPYCPINYEVNDDVYRFDASSWTYDSTMHMIKFVGRGLPKMEHKSAVTCDISGITTYAVPNNISKYNTKITNAESKLYHSDTTTAKLVYDSDYIQIKPEILSEDWERTDIHSTSIPIDFKQTSTINSGMVFKLHPEKYNPQAPLSSDFGQYLMSSRNNEEGLYSYGYYDYLRYGKKYDEEANRIAKNQVYAQAISNTVTTAAQLVTPWITRSIHNKGAEKKFGQSYIEASLQKKGAARDKAIASAFQTYRQDYISKTDTLTSELMPFAYGATSLTGSIISAFTINEQQANSMAAKEANLSNQSVSVSGSPDVDLMEYYSGNRLHYMVYQPTDEMRKALYQIYDVGGYTCNKRGVPNYNNRIWHNFIQCTPVIDDTSRPDCQLVNSYIADVISQYQEGVTILHCINDTWDFKNQYENWETWLFN